MVDILDFMVYDGGTSMGDVSRANALGVGRWEEFCSSNALSLQRSVAPPKSGPIDPPAAPSRSRSCPLG